MRATTIAIPVATANRLFRRDPPSVCALTAFVRDGAAETRPKRISRKAGSGPTIYRTAEGNKSDSGMTPTVTNPDQARHFQPRDRTRKRWLSDVKASCKRVLDDDRQAEGTSAQDCYSLAKAHGSGPNLQRPSPKVRHVAQRCNEFASRNVQPKHDHVNKDFR